MYTNGLITKSFMFMHFCLQNKNFVHNFRICFSFGDFVPKSFISVPFDGCTTEQLFPSDECH